MSHKFNPFNFSHVAPTFEALGLNQDKGILFIQEHKQKIFHAAKKETKLCAAKQIRLCSTLNGKKNLKIGQYYTEKKMDQTDVTDYLPETFRIDLSMY